MLLFVNSEALRPPQSLSVTPEPPLEGMPDSQYSLESMGEMGAGAVQTRTSYAPGARMTVVSTATLHGIMIKGGD